MVAHVNPGHLLKQRRNERNYTLDALADAVGVTASAVAQWEAGRTRPRHRSAQALDVALLADGEILRAFGYVSQPGAETAQPELAARLATLEAEVAEMRAWSTALHAELANRVVALERKRVARRAAQS